MSNPGRRVSLQLLPVLGLLLVVAIPGSAFQTTTLELGTLAGEGWNATGLQMQVNLLDDSHAGVVLQAEAARLPPPVGELRDLRLECAEAEMTAERLDCRDGVLQLHAGEYGRQHIHTRFQYRFIDQHLDFSVDGVRLLGGRIAVQGRGTTSGWQLDIKGEGLELQALSTRLAAAGVIPRVEGSGAVALTAALRGNGAVLAHARYRLQLQAESFTDASGGLAGEELDAVVSGVAQPAPGGWRLQMDAAARKGRLYVDPLFLEVPEQPVELHAQFDFLTVKRELLLHELEYRHPGSVQLAAQGRLDLGSGVSPGDLRVQLRDAKMASLYTTYLRPWLTGTLLGDLDTGGRISGELDWREGDLEKVSLDLADLSVLDREGRFDLAGVSGRLRWSADGSAQVSDLHWQKGSVYRVELGASDWVIETTGRNARLLQPAVIQVLDGELQLETFNLGIGETGSLDWQVDGILTPVSMQRLSMALGWPEFAGKLSGVIPAVRYENGVLSVGGVLLVRVFDGDITLSKMRLERPFGIVPRLQLDARIKNIDLKSLTGTFSFGRIEGRLDGRIDDLEMESWRPVAFDSSFATPAGDKSRHRISQRAVDNISSIGGGGVGGAMSRSFLRFFEDFPYDRLGINCRLKNGVCEMGGIAPADGGYYLVKSRLLPPRLDVIGYSEQVDWEALLAQIMAVTTQPQSPTVE